MDNANVLIVEDDMITQHLARIVLEDAGYVVSVVLSGEEAIDRLDDFVPEVLLIDRDLPGMDGLELTRRLRADDRTREAIVLSFTSRTSITDSSLAIDAGSDGFVHKPFDMQTLLRTVAWYVAERAGRPVRRPTHDAELTRHARPGDDAQPTSAAIERTE